MKVNRSRSMAKRGMRRSGNTSDRPEEKLAYVIIRDHLKGIVQCEKQYIVKFDEGPWCHHARLDIFFILNTGQKYGVRIMGEYHDEKKQERHDRLQYHELLERGYIVIDLLWWDSPNLFARRERLLSEGEIAHAYLDIKRKLARFGLFLKPLKLTSLDYQEYIRQTV